jgi:hypothetical protein
MMLPKWQLQGLFISLLAYGLSFTPPSFALASEVPHQYAIAPLALVLKTPHLCVYVFLYGSFLLPE